jgi:hypothetical protein
MDYCSSCRRHLNGALVCPGCGAYAPDIAPVTSGGRTVPARAATAPASDLADTAVHWEPTRPQASWFDGRPHDGAEDGSEEASAEGAAEGAAPLPEGRAARRRQRARWKKNQRRAVVATTVALIGGGLTFSSMERGSSTDRAQAAAAPELPHTDGGAEEPTAERTLPTAPDTDKRSSSPTPTRSPETNEPHEQSAAAPPHVSRQQARPDTDSALRTTLPLVPKPKPSSPSSSGDSNSGSDSDAEAQTPTPTPSDDSNSGSGSDSDAGATPSAPAPEESSPEQLCLLVICLG